MMKYAMNIKFSLFMEVLRMSKFRIIFYVFFFSAQRRAFVFLRLIYKECVNSVRKEKLIMTEIFPKKILYMIWRGKKLLWRRRLNLSKSFLIWQKVVPEAICLRSVRNAYAFQNHLSRFFI